MDFFRKYFLDTYNFLNDNNHDLFKDTIKLINETHKNKNKIILVGNGGSAAIASHLAVDFTKACKIRAVNFNESALITCFANDYGYENCVVEALRAYSDPKDLLILISSSGQSKNLINAAEQIDNFKLNLITFTGFQSSNPLRKKGIINFWVNSDIYNYVEMVHHIWLVSIVDFIQNMKPNND